MAPGTGPRDPEELDAAGSGAQAEISSATTLGAVHHSPAGLAAWIVEKWRSWRHSLDAIDRDLLLTNMMMYWVTETIGPMPRGGHFPPAEAPDLLAHDIRECFAAL
jgi:epoxide hydrolase